MLTITHDAADAIKAVMGSNEGGLRIYTGGQAANGNQPGLALEPVPEPTEDDEVVEREGALVFVDATAAESLDDKVLDAEHMGDVVRFSISTQ